jgi:pilus assembly protein Flp/PilA
VPYKRWPVRCNFSQIDKELFMNAIKHFMQEEDGATAVEYGLLVALIAAVIVGTVETLGTQINAAFQTVVDALPAAPAAP